MVKAKYVISLKSKIDLIPNDFKCGPPKQRYSISEVFFLRLEITLDANLSPEGSPVTIKIFFILLSKTFCFY